MGSRQVKSRATREMTDQALPIGATAIKPVERHGWEAFSWFMYDKNTGAIMGRTPLSWLLITVFFIIYYSCLAGFWALCLFIFYQFIENHQPRWQMADGLIGKSPALGVRPGQHDSIIESSVIIFNHENPNDDENIPGYQQWVDRLDEYLKPYRAAPASENGMDCATDSAATDVKQEDYQSPLVAVKINDINPGQLIHVECRAWAKNIKYNRRDRVGIVRFEVMNHNSKTTEEVNKLN